MGHKLMGVVLAQCTKIHNQDTTSVDSAFCSNFQVAGGNTATMWLFSETATLKPMLMGTNTIHKDCQAMTSAITKWPEEGNQNIFNTWPTFKEPI